MGFEKEKLAVEYCEQHCINDERLENACINAFCSGYSFGAKSSLPAEVEQALDFIDGITYEKIPYGHLNAGCATRNANKATTILAACQHLRRKA